MSATGSVLDAAAALYESLPRDQKVAARRRATLCVAVAGGLDDAVATVVAALAGLVGRGDEIDAEVEAIQKQK